MNNTASLLLLLVAAGLLILAGTSVGRARGRPPSATDAALMAGMTGVTIGFLVMFLSASMLTIGPVAIGAVLVWAWAARGQSQLIGAFLVGGGLLVASMQTWSLLNDLSDLAVTIPGWTPGPLVLGVASALIGASLLIAQRPRTR